MRLVPIYKYSNLEVRRYKYGLHCGFPKTRRYHDSTWVIIDRMKRSSHFNNVKVSHSMEDYAKLYIRDSEVACGTFIYYFGLGNSIYFTLLEVIPKRACTKVKLSPNFHPQPDEQEEYTIQTLEDLFRACVIDFKGNWDDHL